MLKKDASANIKDWLNNFWPITAKFIQRMTILSEQACANEMVCVWNERMGMFGERCVSGSVCRTACACVEPMCACASVCI